MIRDVSMAVGSSQETVRQQRIDESKIVSVVVPMYNAECTIGNCLASILSQTYSNLEVIVVDDGSADRTAELCKVLAEEDHRITLVHCPHYGVSRARNVGMKRAEGEWLVFVDSDDMLPKTAITELVMTGKQFDTDIVAGGMSFEDANGRVSVKEKRFGDTRRIDALGQDFERLYNTNCLQSSCAKAYRLVKVRDNDLSFDEQLSSYEDFEFVLRCLAVNLTLFVTNEICYHYLRHTKGTGSTSYKPDMTDQMEAIANRVTYFYEQYLDGGAKQSRLSHVMRYLVISVNNAVSVPCTKQGRLSMLSDAFSRPVFADAAKNAAVFPNRYSELVAKLGTQGHYGLLLRLVSIRNWIRNRYVA